LRTHKFTPSQYGFEKQTDSDEKHCYRKDAL
jgi:hypothetical protein